MWQRSQDALAGAKQPSNDAANPCPSADGVRVDHRNNSFCEGPPPGPVQDENAHDPLRSFIAWINHTLRSQPAALNQENSLFFRVEAGLLIRWPAAWQAFVKIHPGWNNLDVMSFVKDEWFVRHTATPSFLHPYFWGNWHQQQKITGLLLTRERLAEALPTLPLTPHCQPEPEL